MATPSPRPHVAAAWIALALALAVLGCGHSEPAFPKQPYAFPTEAAEAPRIERIACSISVDKRRMSLEAAMRQYNVQGVSAAAMVGGRVVWARAWGLADAAKRTPMRPETVMQAASVSKPLTAVAVMRMVQAGKLNLDADVTQYFDGWEPQFKGRKARLTLRQLLSHSAGLNVHGFKGYKSTVSDLPSTIDILNGRGNSAKVKVALAPSAQQEYSGGGFVVVQAAIEGEVQDPFEAAMYDWLIKPFGLRRTTFMQPPSDDNLRTLASAHGPDGRPIPGRFHVYPMMAAAGMWTTPTDLLTVAGSLSASYNGAGGPLSTALVRQMLTTQSPTGSVGIGWFLADRGGGVMEASHSGLNEGFSSAVSWRTDGFGAAVMVNGEGPIAGGLLRAIGEAYGWRESSGGGCAN
ncbi:MAG: beta-lactamase family protein [Polyangiaceae bacterium]|nr:beta-lactamase family protein [Polyangiaceae bacterium]